jgi:hypothetical protein
MVWYWNDQDNTTANTTHKHTHTVHTPINSKPIFYYLTGKAPFYPTVGLV